MPGTPAGRSCTCKGVPIVVISQWLGHADPAFTMRTYLHSDDALNIAAANVVPPVRIELYSAVLVTGLNHR